LYASTRRASERTLAYVFCCQGNKGFYYGPGPFDLIKASKFGLGRFHVWLGRANRSSSGIRVLLYGTIRTKPREVGQLWRGGDPPRPGCCSPLCLNPWRGGSYEEGRRPSVGALVGSAPNGSRSFRWDVPDHLKANQMEDY